MSAIEIARSLGISHNVSLRVIDKGTNTCVQEHIGHNAATDSLLKGIAHYLVGNGIFNQGSYMLTNYIPKYISLGTMGLINQSADADGLPAGLGVGSMSDTEEQRFIKYMEQIPGYGADGYDSTLNNGRAFLGLGNQFLDTAINCELVSTTFPRAQISFRDVVPENLAELPKTIDVVFSAMISTGALSQFRPEGLDHIFITEVGLWSTKTYSASYNNGLLAGYRIAPPSRDDWDMSIPANREALKQQIIRVGVNQVVQVVWKIQLGAIEQLYPQI